ncbi:cyclic nucleotide-binding protein (plasmid) [Rhizobium grahamii]|uniref:Cyclic nucleotide-binding protein n=1 Tax=Rhizobium grahamii TaxID=1120045 RepID=A0A5Q0C9M6_9HYPH|nr:MULTISPECIES: cyclic nucleotide-binding protein [Rhizobium]QFY62596.1 cyclic nucleotide-binding protein [Rhizobium grahamii]QRM52664.1 cyclic nucleotide-binding protein [Rhizobium sp. BG6]
MTLPDIVGLIGAVFYLTAYALLQLRVLAVEDSRTTLLNVLGGICLIYSLSCNFNLGSLVTQVAWLFFTIIGYVRFRMARTRMGG